MGKYQLNGIVLARIILFGFVLCLSFFETNGQAVSIRPEAGLNGAKMRMEYNSLSGIRNYKTQYSLRYKFGLAVRVAAGSGLFIEPGLYYATKGFQKNNTEFAIRLFPYVIEGKSQLNVRSLELPIHLGYDFKIRNAGNLFFYVGPYLGAALKAKIYYEAMGEKWNEDISVGNTDKDEMRFMDIGLDVGCAFQTRSGIFLRLQYGFGAVNQIPDAFDEDYLMKHRVIGLSVGYNLPIKG